MRTDAAMKTSEKLAANRRKKAAVIAGVVAVSLTCASAWAAGGGEVTHLSGTLSVQRTDGTMLVLGQKSEVRAGDVLSTQKDSYAQINFQDGSTVTMRPYTQMKIDAFNYVQDKPQEDNAFFRLIKGGLRTVTGLVGKRGNQDAYRIGTATATIGIRGSVGDTVSCEPSCAGVMPGGESLTQGTHHQTLNGSYVMQTGGQTVVINEGNSGFSNGADIKVSIGAIGGGTVNFTIPIGGGGLKGAGCP
jgi:hypothetical protein